MGEGGLTLVTGGTGRQGGAVVRHLLARGAPVRVLTRDPQSLAARRLSAQGVQVRRGDLDDEASLDDALRGVGAVFSVQDYWQPGVGATGEVRQGKNLVDAAARAGVGLFIQSSMAGDVLVPEVPHFASKHAVTEYLKTSGIPSVVLGLVVFMDNFVQPRVGRLMMPTLAGGLGSHTPLQLLATDDVGAAVARITESPDGYLGRRFDLVGEVLTVSQMRATYRRELNRPMLAWAFPRPMLRRISTEFAEQLAWHRRSGWPATTSSGVGEQMTDLATFLRIHRPTLW